MSGNNPTGDGWRKSLKSNPSGNCVEIKLITEDQER